MYCATVYSRKGVKQVWILKIPKERLGSLKLSVFFLKSTASKTFDFTTLYTITPHDELKT
jgi:hypothetical protein